MTNIKNQSHNFPRMLASFLCFATIFSLFLCCEPTAYAASYSKGIYVVSASAGSNVRQTPNGKIVGASKKETSFTVEKISGSWGYTSSIKTTKGTKKGWVCLNYCKKKAQTNITYSDMGDIKEIVQGSGVHINGTVKATNSKIKSIRAEVINTSNNKKHISESVKLNTLSYKLYNSDLDWHLKFTVLPAGNYKLVYTAQTHDGHSKSYTDTFVVKPKNVPKTKITFSVSKIGTITEGQKLVFPGTVNSSTSNLISLTVKITNTETKKVVFNKTVNPGVKTYSFSKLNSITLSKGKYQLVYTAKAKDGTTNKYTEDFNVVAKKTSVKKGTADSVVAKAKSVIGKNYKYFGFSNDWCAQFVCWAGTGADFPKTNYGYPSDVAAWFINNNKETYYSYKDDIYKDNKSYNLIKRKIKKGQEKNLKKDIKRSSSFNPKAGDLVLFRFNKTDAISHIAIVTSYDAKKGIVTTVDGNTSGYGDPYWKNSKVDVKKRSINSVVGIVRPNYK